MKLTPMRFGNFQWPHNPSQIKITSGRDLYEVGLAGSGGILQDRGCKRRVITDSIRKSAIYCGLGKATC